MFYLSDFNVYTLKILGFVWFFWIFWTFLIFFIIDWNLVKWSYQLQKKFFVEIWPNLNQKWQKIKVFNKFKKFEKNLKLWWYERWNSIKIDCCTAKQSWLVKPPNFTKPHFFHKKIVFSDVSSKSHTLLDKFASFHELFLYYINFLNLNDICCRAKPTNQIFWIFSYIFIFDTK